MGGWAGGWVLEWFVQRVVPLGSWCFGVKISPSDSPRGGCFGPGCSSLILSDQTRNPLPSGIACSIT